MWLKILIIVLLIWMIYNLFKALFVMNKGKASQEKMSTFIGRRVMASAAIVALLVILILTGVITPNPRPY